MNKKKTWSFSSIQKYRSCPRKYNLHYNENIKERRPGTPPKKYGVWPDIHGKEIHNNIENYLLKKEDTPHSDIHSNMVSELQKIRKKNVQVEVEYKFNKNWDKLESGEKNYWLKIIVDAIYKDDNNTIHIIDYKTGKKKPEHMSQIMLYASALFHTFEKGVNVVAELWYTKTGKIEYYPVDIKNVVKVKIYYDNLAEEALNDVIFEAIPSWQCKYCSYANAEIDGNEWVMYQNVCGDNQVIRA